MNFSIGILFTTWSLLQGEIYQATRYISHPKYLPATAAVYLRPGIAYDRGRRAYVCGFGPNHVSDPNQWLLRIPWREVLRGRLDGPAFRNV